MALRPGLLLDLIVSDDHAQQGAYTFQFYKHGCWHQVSGCTRWPVEAGCFGPCPRSYNCGLLFCPDNDVSEILLLPADNGG